MNPGPRQEPSTSSLPWWGEAALIGIGSRLFAVGILVTVFTVHYARAHRSWPSPFAIWDGFWFLHIAGTGYHAEAVVKTAYGIGYHDFAFFPAWPAVIRVLTLNGLLPFDAMAAIGANVLFVLASIPVYRVLERVGGAAYARLGLVLFAFSPAAYVFSLDYSEPLFILFAALFFLASSPARSGVAAALAMFTRLAGVALAAASVADLFRPETRWRGAASIAAVAFAFALWWAFIARLTGEPMGYMQGSPSWYAAEKVPQPLGFGALFGETQPWGVLVTLYLFVLVAGAAQLIRAGELRLGFFGIACVGSAILVALTTMPRLASVAFPVFGGLGALMPTRAARLALVAAFASFEALSASLAVLHVSVP